MTCSDLIGAALLAAAAEQVEYRHDTRPFLLVKGLARQTNRKSSLLCIYGQRRFNWKLFWMYHMTDKIETVAMTKLITFSYFDHVFVCPRSLLYSCRGSFFKALIDF